MYVRKIHPCMKRSNTEQNDLLASREMYMRKIQSNEVRPLASEDQQECETLDNESLRKALFWLLWVSCRLGTTGDLGHTHNRSDVHSQKPCPSG